MIVLVLKSPFNPETHDFCMGSTNHSWVVAHPFCSLSLSLFAPRGDISWVPRTAVTLCEGRTWGSCAPGHRLGNARIDDTLPVSRWSNSQLAYWPWEKICSLTSGVPSWNRAIVPARLRGPPGTKQGLGHWRRNDGPPSTAITYCGPRSLQSPVHVRS